jgi:RND family efflux transporter MFP subunit
MSIPKKKGSMIRRIIRIVLPVCLVLAGVGGFNYFKSQEVKMKRKPIEKQAAVVETIALTPGNFQTYVHAMGTVMPDRQITLKAKVAGEVIFVSESFVQGGLMKKGETLLLLDDSDYQIEVQKVQSALDKALSDLAIEQGSQLIAREELKLINLVSKTQMIQTDLALRKPQLDQANAVVKNARADLEKARLNLSRTKIVVPFNALVLEKQVDSGSLATTQGELATLVDVDAFLVEALVPPDRLAALTIDEKTGSKAVIRSQYSQEPWQGTLVRTTGKISSKSRMAGVIISILDPLGLTRRAGRPQLLLDDYVDVRIQGQILENVFSIPRSILRDKNTVWVYQSGKLVIKQVSLAWKEEGRVFIRSGILPGDEVITSDLPAPVNGMALQQDSGASS